MSTSFATAALNSNYNCNNKTYTENGAIINETTGHTGVSAFNKLVRDETRNVKTGKVKFNRDKRCANTDDKRKFILELETDTSAQAVREYYGDMINTAKNHLENNIEDARALMLDVWKLPFYKRCFTKTITNEDGSITKHTGEGERLIFYQMFIELYKHFPHTAISTIYEIPKFGYWGDLFTIWQLMDDRINKCIDNGLNNDNVQHYKLMVINHIITQIKQDKYNMLEQKDVSLLAKWIPREASTKDRNCIIELPVGNSGRTITYTFYTALAILFSKYKNQGATSESYIMNYILSILTEETYNSKQLSLFRKNLRKNISTLNKYIKTFETYACSHRWSEVNPGSIPSKALNKYKTAILNEKRGIAMNTEEEHTGNRYPNDLDRVNARNNFIQHIINGKNINVSGIEPHEILNSYMSDNVSTINKKISMIQWEQKVEEVFNSMIEAEGLDVNDKAQLTNSRICKLIPMMDVSGSMTGIPMDVSIGLGLFIIALQKRFGLDRQIAISFTETPRVFDFTNMNLDEQIEQVYNHVGFGTNFETAVDLVLDAIKVSGQMKELIVFTDGQFDQMNTVYRRPTKSWLTSHQHIQDKVANLGLSEMPNIIYWNLRLNTPGVQTSAEHPGVQLLQGYSPSILKFILYGNYEETNITVTTDTGEVKDIKVSSKTPYDTYREALDQPQFMVIENIVMNSNEGLLSTVNYN